MADLAKTGMYTVDAETLARIQASFACGCADDTDGAAEIKARFEQDNYSCDTHTAVASCVAETVRSTGAHGGAFPPPARTSSRAMCWPLLGETAPESDFVAMVALNAKNRLPGFRASLGVLNTLPVRFQYRY